MILCHQVFFIFFGSSVLGYGEEALIAASPIWKIDHRLIFVLGECARISKRLYRPHTVACGL